jgi:putative ABC transport system substrate-binding protein
VQPCQGHTKAIRHGPTPTVEFALGGKWPELLSEIAPGLKRAAIMFNPDTAPVSYFMPSFETAARSLKVEVPEGLPVSVEGDPRLLRRTGGGKQV